MRGNSIERLHQKVGMMNVKFHEAMEQFAGVKGELKMLKWVSVGIFVEVFLASLKILIGR